ncbi:MAG: 3-oxo-5-alpha-steroid 4-dehydrogenase [Bacteroidales bacterium]
MLFNSQTYNFIIAAMTITGLSVFIILFFIEAGYGILLDKKWGRTINSKAGWFLMEAPVFVVMATIFLLFGRDAQSGNLLIFSLFMLHYLHRAFIYPHLIVGNGKMPLSIISMGVFFNLVNGSLQGEWLFSLAPEDYYGTIPDLITSPRFISGAILFFGGMALNIDSDRRLRMARKDGLQKGDKPGTHYIPDGAGFKFVTSPNYLGEIIEWTGFALMIWSLSGFLFAFWTVANLVPRAASTWNRHKAERGDEIKERRLMRVFPYIY